MLLSLSREVTGVGLSLLGPSSVDNATFLTLEFWATDLSAAFLLGIAKHPKLYVVHPRTSPASATTGCPWLGQYMAPQAT